MKVYFHVGPHKTGTSSIQHFLRRFYGAARPQSVWYPAGRYVGEAAGHGPLASRLTRKQGAYDRAGGLALLDELKAEAAGADKLLISSENFSFASPGDLSAIRDVFSGCEFHLLFTASPLLRRYVSAYNTLLQFGETETIEECAPIVERVPGFKADYFSATHRALRPDACHLVIGAPAAPQDQLLRDFLAACGLPWPEGVEAEATKRRNLSLGRREAEFLRLANRLYAEETEEIKRGAIFAERRKARRYLAFRKMLLQVMQSPEWRMAFRAERLVAPEAAIPGLMELGRAIVADVRSMQQDGRLTATGDVDALAAGLEG